MRINAITCCVGRQYAEYLANSLDAWLDTLDHLTIVTKVGDPAIQFAGRRENLTIVTTDVFTQHGALFNKGAALCEAFARSKPRDWCLAFDADIIPPVGWRAVCEEKVRTGCIHGSTRYDIDGHDVDTSPRWPFGFFQLWHAADWAQLRWPIFSPAFAHAGSYDGDFAELWPRIRWRHIRMRLIHQGPRRTNWFGEGNSSRMPALIKEGLRRHRMDATKHLVLPEPEHRINLISNDTDWVLGQLESIRELGPFKIHMRTNESGIGWEDRPQFSTISAVQAYRS